MEDTTCENAVNEELQEIHRMVETVKKDQEVGGMRIQIIDEIIKLSEENARQAEVITNQTEENARQAEVITNQTEENARQAEVINKLQEEIAKLQEALNRRNAMEK